MAMAVDCGAVIGAAVATNSVGGLVSDSAFACDSEGVIAGRAATTPRMTTAVGRRRTTVAVSTREAPSGNETPPQERACATHRVDRRTCLMVVFMPCMPVGLALIVVRAGLPAARALTAGAVPSVQSCTLAAAMDAVISKPKDGGGMSSVIGDSARETALGR